MNLDILDIWNIRENKHFFHVATHGLEGLTNLRNTMFDNDSQCPDLGVRQNRCGRGVWCGQMLRAWYLQVFVGKTDISSVLYRDAYLFELIHSPNSVNPG